MSDQANFADFLKRVREGDQQAAYELVQRYEKLIRREVRLHLEDERLGRVFDSMDICQSVLASFFLRSAAGEYDLEQPGQLVGLLVKMARNKLASTARQQAAQKRDYRRDGAAGDAMDLVASSEPTPSRTLAGKELLEQFNQRLSDEERKVAELRHEGLAWQEVADRLGGTAQARRMQLVRAVDRVTRELGLEEEDS